MNKIQSSAYYLTEFKVSNTKEYKQTMINISNCNNLFWVGDICFGIAYIRCYDLKSHIKGSDIYLSPNDVKGCFNNGKFYPFTEKQLNPKPKQNKKYKTFIGG